MVSAHARNWLLSASLLVISLAFSVLILEAGIRLVVDPVDYLLPTIVQDLNLGHRVEAGSGGHDEWGFRNYERPNKAEVVAIGDSMTYGIAARAQESWPVALSELTGKSTYNMGLGGYGPLHYLYLLRESARKLQPESAVVGLYFGNDFLDVINLAYGNDNWAAYRIRDLSQTNSRRGFVIDQPESGRGKFLGGLRNYLAGHSVLYRLTTSLAILDRFRAVNVNSEDAGLFVFSMGERTTILTPTQNKLLMDLDDPQIETAIEITKQAVLEMQKVSRNAQIDLHVLLLPTKELVFAELLEEHDRINAHPDMAAAILYEQTIREDLLSFLEGAGLSYVDPLPALRSAVRAEVVYPFNDGHPNAAGYRLIAEQIAVALSN